MGTVISYNSDRGYGFIRSSDGRNYFFHVSDCFCPEEEIHVGVKVVFVIKEYPRQGIMTPKAVHVQIA